VPYDLAPFAAVLNTYSPIDAEDRKALLSLPFETQPIRGNLRLAYPGQGKRELLVLLDGFSLRQKLTSSGERHISALHIAGDALNLSAMFTDDIDYEVVPISGATVAVIQLEAVVGLLRDRPAIFTALFSSLLVDASATREWLLNQSRRPSRARVAHFLCEHATRMTGRGLVENKTIELGVTQEQLADLLGLTTVHVNRTLRLIEKDGLITRNGRHYKIINRTALQESADFKPSYLYPSIGKIDHIGSE
jgi:CRP-like cAMP-binding protein